MAAAIAQHAAERKLFVAGGHAAANGPNKLVISVYVPRRSSLFMHKAHAAPRCTAKSKRTGNPCRCNADHESAKDGGGNQRLARAAATTPKSSTVGFRTRRRRTLIVLQDRVASDLSWRYSPQYARKLSASRSRLLRLRAGAVYLGNTQYAPAPEKDREQ